MSRAHRGYETAVLVGVLGVVSIGVAGLGAAIAGVAGPTTVFPAAAVLFVILAALWGRDAGSEAVTAPRPVPLLAIVLALVIVGFSAIAHATHNGQYIRTDRDPGIYTAGGFWIAEHGDLFVDGLVDGFDESQSLTGVASGQWPIEGDSTRLEIQAQHLFPVLLASGRWAGGAIGFQLVPALIGSLALAAFFALVLRIVRWWLALAATAALAANFVFLYAVRSTLSEPTSLLFATAGLWLTIRGIEDRSPRRLIVAGTVLGASLCTRIDGGVGVAAMPIAVAIASVVIERRDGTRVGGRLLTAFAAGLVALLLLARVDLYERSSFYARNQADKIQLVELAVVAGLLIAVGVLVIGRLLRDGRLETITDRIGRIRTRIGAAAVVAVLVLFAFLWFARPLLGPARSPMNEGGLPTMEAIQAREGVTPDPTRSFDEVSVERITWYIGGITMVLAVAGLAVLVHRMITRRDGERAVILLAAMTPTLLLYLWRPSIFPDQPWMMRRYLPIAIPGLLLAAVIAISAALDVLPRFVEDERTRSWAARIGATAAVAAMVLAPLQITKPLRSIRWMPGGYHGMERLCDALGPDASVIFSNSEATAITLMPAFRGICDLPAARPAQQPFVDPLPIEEIRESVEAEGRRLWIVGPTPESVAQTAPTAADARRIELVSSDILRSTMFHPPARTEPMHLEVWYAPVPEPVSAAAP